MREGGVEKVEIGLGGRRQIQIDFSEKTHIGFAVEKKSFHVEMKFPRKGFRRMIFIKTFDIDFFDDRLVLDLVKILGAIIL